MPTHLDIVDAVARPFLPVDGTPPVCLAGRVQVFIPPVQAALWLAAQQAMARLGAPQLGRRGRGSRGLRRAGGVLVATAAGFGGSSLRAYVARGTTWHPWNPHHAELLITDGPNAVSRNPMYVALATGLVGTGLASRRPWTALAGLGLVATLTPQVRREERALASVFGPDYDRYRARVRPWL